MTDKLLAVLWGLMLFSIGVILILLGGAIVYYTLTGKM